MQCVKVNVKNACTIFMTDNPDYFSRNMLNRTEHIGKCFMNCTLCSLFSENISIWIDLK
jgi:hypothetical protein